MRSSKSKKKMKAICTVAVAFVFAVVLYLINPLGVFDGSYNSRGNKELSHYQYESALRAYRKCRNDTDAKSRAEVIQKIMEKDYYGAASIADASFDYNDVSREQWTSVLNHYFHESEDSGTVDINQALNYVYARSIFSRDSVSRNSLTADSFTNALMIENLGVPIDFTMIGKPENNSSGWYVVDDLDSFYQQCGENSEGKILILVESHSYASNSRNKEVRYAVSLDLMEQLPVSYIPLSLDEVEYVVMVTYDYELEGYYLGGGDALRENAFVKIYQFPGPKSKYVSEEIEGENPPYTVSHKSEWHTGGAPNGGGEVYNAVLSIIQ